MWWLIFSELGQVTGDEQNDTALAMRKATFGGATTTGEAKQVAH
jgi:hypothetical protein